MDMFELRREPKQTDLMRHAAWERQQRAILTLHEAQSRTSMRLTASHFTAAHLMGIPTPKQPKSTDVYVCVKQGQSRLRVHNLQCRTWNNTDSTGNTIEIAGILCSSPEATFAQLSRELLLEDAIVLGDALVCRDEMLRRTSKRKINQYLRDCLPFRHQHNCLQASSLIRENTDSPAETRLRLTLLKYGFPEPKVNYRLDINNAHYFLDMAYPEYRIGIEFNGQHHHYQIAEDLDRLNIIQSRGWHVFAVERNNIGTRSLDLRFCNYLNQAFREAGKHHSEYLSCPMPLSQLCDLRRAHTN
ncbi:DUF559 domain-containing protein [Bifidobacterium sp. ESL0784]|uniref:endonuclease domain-containing protein n=1 Tax=Bifidobacterium sp. ESL0784 TaxID=2983231 RepID=UPI0023F944A8|nr:DUF559 domain-containing protein [Bifidobacterium sp. ESL0784]MDF7640253.1 DUF559 domain-containing protein [Bifidobacterium sp. ESL0784]